MPYVEAMDSHHTVAMQVITMGTNVLQDSLFINILSV